MIEMVAYIKEHVISKERPQYVSDLLQRFKELYISQEDKSSDAKFYSVQHLKTKFKKEFNQNETGIKADGTKKTIIWTNVSMPLTHAGHFSK